MRDANDTASMRPPEFTGGNSLSEILGLLNGRRFNEAAGIHRRKLGTATNGMMELLSASMRPPEFTGGNYLPVGGAATAYVTLQ